MSFNGTDDNCNISVPHWNYFTTSTKQFSVMKIVLKQENRTLELHLLKLLRTQNTLQKETSWKPTQPYGMSLNKMSFLENIQWHSSNQLSLQKLTYTLTVIVTGTVTFWMPLFLLGAMLPHVIPSTRNDSKKFSSWRVHVYFPVWIPKGGRKDCNNIQRKQIGWQTRKILSHHSASSWSINTKQCIQ